MKKVQFLILVLLSLSQNINAQYFTDLKNIEGKNKNEIDQLLFGLELSIGTDSIITNNLIIRLNKVIGNKKYKKEEKLLKVYKARISATKGNYDEANKVLNEELNFAINNKEVYLQTRAMSYLAANYNETNKYNESFEIALQLEKLGNKENDNYAIAVSNNIRGIIVGKKGLFDSSTKYFQKAVSLFPLPKYELIQAKSKLNICLQIASQGKASSLNLKMIDTCSEIFKRYENISMQLRCYNFMTIYYQNGGDYKKCLEAARKQCKMAVSINDVININFCFNNMANAFIYLKQPDSALKYFNLSYELAKKRNDEDLLTEALSGIGQAYNETKNYSIAIAKLNEALYLSRKNESLESMGLVLIRLGNAYMGLKVYNKALDYYNQSTLIADSINDKELKSKGLKHQYEIYALEKNYKMAYTVLTNYHNISDSLISENLLDSTKALQTEFENKIQEEKILSGQIVLKQKEKEVKWFIGGLITASMLAIFISFLLYKQRQKNIQLKNLSQDVFNQSHTINSLMDMLTHETLGQFKQIKNNLASALNENDLSKEKISAALNNVILYELLYRDIFLSGGKVQLSIKKMAEIIYNYYCKLNNIAPEFTYQTNNDEMAVMANIGFAQYLNELFSNSFKHAFDNIKNPKITVKANEKNGELNFIYSDNGIGIVEEKQHNNPEKGLGLLKKYANDIFEGTLKFENKNGATYTLIFSNT